MSSKSTFEKFIEKVKIVHGNKYDYSLVNYEGSHMKVKIICPKHGTFLQAASEHIRGYGCKKCSHDKRKSTLKEFINKANEIHKNKYDYSLVIYQNSKTKVKIICATHGVFEQAPITHLSGNMCFHCSYEKSRWTLDKFIKHSNEIYNSKYDYSLVDFKNTTTKVKIICPKHGIFEQKPNNHLRGWSCKSCSATGKLLLEEFIERSNKNHNNFYDYSLAEYKGSQIKIKIICPEHGIFEQTPDCHYVHGCKECSREKSKLTLQEFLDKANEIHKNKYDYSLTIYENVLTKVKIICPKHGIFEQTPKNHVVGHGCNKCRQVSSKYHIELYNILNQNIDNVDIVLERPIKVDKKYYFADILLIKEKIIVEYNGDYWHCNPKIYKENYFNKKKNMFAKDIWDYDNNRNQQLENLGYKNFIVWENDFRKNKEETVDKLVSDIKESINQ